MAKFITQYFTNNATVNTLSLIIDAKAIIISPVFTPVPGLRVALFDKGGIESDVFIVLNGVTLIFDEPVHKIEVTNLAPGNNYRIVTSNNLKYITAS